MPRRVRPELNIPDEATIKELYKAAEGTPLEVPILLASIGAMRRGEIVAATLDDIKDGYIHIHRAAALNDRQEQIIKEYPKTEGSDRYILLPDAVIQKIMKQGCVCSVGLTYISTMFPRLLRKVGIQHFRFHDLRHAFVSIAHAAGLPDAYIMERGGWSTTYTMTNVYRHTLTEDRKKQNEKVNNVFADLL